jgi:toxin YoeB
MRDILLKDRALEDLKYWSLNDTKFLKKIFDLLESIKRNPFEGIGKPEALKGDLRGYWSRRINDEHRIVYSITNDTIIIISCRSHYKL